MSSCAAKKNSTQENLINQSVKYDRELIPIPSDSKREAGNYKILEAILDENFIYITVEPVDFFNEYIYDIIELPVTSNSTTIKKRLILIQTEDFSKLDDTKPLRDPKKTSNVVKFILKVDINSITTELKSGEKIEFSIDEYDGKIIFTKK
jgi:hypothetical protein